MPSVVFNSVAEGTGAFGYNAASGEFGDMIEFSILDPTKVTRMALQNAAPIAALMNTTEAMIMKHRRTKSLRCWVRVEWMV